jgi:hypothetical protein
MGHRAVSRTASLLGALAVGAALAAAAMALIGMRSSPRSEEAPVLADRAEADPMAPRLFERNDSIRVHVAGAVRKPGVYSLPAWARVVDAVKKAGGATPEADLDNINLADYLRDGEQLRVPARNRPTRATHPPTVAPPPAPPWVGGKGRGRYPFAVETDAPGEPAWGDARTPVHPAHPAGLPEGVGAPNTHGELRQGVSGVRAAPLTFLPQAPRR